MQNKQLKGLIIGATGGIGQELIKILLKSSKWSEVNVIVRKELDEWKQLPKEQQDKLKIIKLDSFDDLQDQNKYNNKFTDIDSVFCCLGAQQKNGKDNFIKVDQIYPLYLAQIAKQNNIQQYHIVTAKLADRKSMFFYMKVKGEVEYQLQQQQFQFLNIYRPGLLLNRSQPRLVEQVMSYIPFISKADVKDIAKCMKLQSEENYNLINSGNGNSVRTQIFENNKINKIAKNSQ